MKTFTVTTFGIFELTENGSILIRKKVKNSNYESIKWIIKNFGNCYIIEVI